MTNLIKETDIKTGKLVSNKNYIYQFGEKTPAHHKLMSLWIVIWDDPVKGLTNISLPLHPDHLYDDGDLQSDYYPELKEGGTVKFTQVVFNDIFGYYDCAKLLSPPLATLLNSKENDTVTDTDYNKEAEELYPNKEVWEKTYGKSSHDVNYSEKERAAHIKARKMLDQRGIMNKLIEWLDICKENGFEDINTNSVIAKATELLNKPG